MMKSFKQLAVESLAIWLPIAALATILCLTVYGAVQQSIRSAANDPQIQLAENAATVLNTGQDPQTLVPSSAIDMEKDLSPYLMVFDEGGNPIVASARVGGGIPIPPKGVFDHAKASGQNRITWQPRPNIRSAIVVVPYSSPQKSGFVLAGRSLREVEKRTAWLATAILAAWLVALVGTFLAAMAGRYLLRTSRIRD